MSLENLLNELAGTAELMGKQLSPVALAMMAKYLSAYDYKIISEALKNVRNGTKPFSQGAIMAEIESLLPDGRLGPEEAWAIYPHNEFDSAVITDEMAAAMCSAHALVCEGDLIGARMAFKEAYARIVKTNKANNIAPKWFPSLGSVKEGREEALKQAVALGRIGQEHATSLLPYQIPNSVVNAIQEVKLLTTKEAALTDEEKEKSRAKIKQIKEMLQGAQA